MKKLVLLLLAALIIAFSGMSFATNNLISELPENIALKAQISADFEYSSLYMAKFVADNYIPDSGSQDDAGKAWCVNGVDQGQKATIVFEWDKPQVVSSIVYFGRTAWYVNECWKDYEVYIDNGVTPVKTGQLKAMHGPQIIQLQSPVSAKRLFIKFNSAYGGNPGASEIQIYSKTVSANGIKKIMAVLDEQALGIPLDKVDINNLRRLIYELSVLHGKRYPQSGKHLARLHNIEQAAETGRNVSGDLAELQRDVLLFDANKLLVIKRYEITPSHVYTYHYEGYRPGGGIYIISPSHPEIKPVELVSSPNGQILDCDLSYDAKTVLFSWRKGPNEGYHLWTVNIDGTGLKQITGGKWHDYNACWLPDGGIGFLSTRSPQFAYCWNAPVGTLYRMDADGSNVKVLSANYLNDFTPYPLDDGRIIYSRWEYVDRPAIPIQSMWTINPDGTGLSVYFGNRVISPGTFMDARPIPGTTKIICTMTGHNGPPRGAIGIIDRTYGVNAQASITNITPKEIIPPVDQGYGNTEGNKPYSCPLPLDSTRFLVSMKGPIIVRSMDGTCQSTALKTPGNGMQYFYAQPIRERHRPPIIPSSITPVKAEKSYAYIYIQDVYNGLEPYIKRGEIETIRVIREMPKTVRIDPTKLAFGFQFPVISCGATYAAKDVIGETPVNDDGSAYFKVPSGVPIYFLALDHEGRAVQRMRSFTHLMPGETQGCIGCHEPRNQAGRLDKPISAMNAPPRDLEIPEWGSGGFDYSKTVQPVLDKYCVQCHGNIAPPNDVYLTGDKTEFFSVSYETLARGRKGSPGLEYDNPYTSWIPTYNGMEQNILVTRPKSWGSPVSKLTEIILTGHPDKNGVPRFNMDSASRRRIIAWIDLDVPYYSSSETAYPDNIGCRRIYPDDLDKTLADVVQRRCIECHAGGSIPRKIYTRITEPAYNTFLLAPLAKSAGGSGVCGKAVFQTKNDPDYQVIIRTFDPILKMLAEKPRMDMPGGKSAPDVCRDRY